MLNRIEPALPAAAMKTYRISAPLATHWRPATCEEVDCAHYTGGWATTVMVDSADEAAIRGSGRHWAARELQPGGFVRYTFPPGQPCFAASAHKLRVDRAETYLLQGGDYRGNPRGLPARALSPQDWLDDFGEHQERLADQVQRG